MNLNVLLARALIALSALPLAATAAEMKPAATPVVKPAASSAGPVVGPANQPGANDCQAVGGAQTPGSTGNGQQGASVIGPKKPKCPVPKVVVTK